LANATSKNNSERLSGLLYHFIVERRWRRWLLVLIILAAAIYAAYAVRAIWLPLGLAFLIALVLDPVVDRMESRGWGRTPATVFIFASFLIIVFGVGWLTVPVVVEQGSELAAKVDQRLPDRSPEGIAKMLAQNGASPAIQNLSEVVVRSLQHTAAKSSQWISEHSLEVAESLIWLVIVPIVSFYALKDFHVIFAKGLLLVPKGRRDLVQDLVAEVSGIFGKYMRGLLLVSFLNGLFTYLLLLALGTDSALLLGCIAGILYPVPYLGALTTVVLIVGVEFVTRGTSMLIPVLGANIVLHQIIFDYIISPRILGGHVGLHPIWAIVALLTGNALMGLAGMIIAVPVAASIQIAIITLIPKLAVDVDVPAPDEDSVEELAEETKAQHIEPDASTAIHKSLSDIVEKIEDEAAEPPVAS
jgi:predicted PurR-regulated permease PerM